MKEGLIVMVINDQFGTSDLQSSLQQHPVTGSPSGKLAWDTSATITLFP